MLSVALLSVAGLSSGCSQLRNPEYDLTSAGCTRSSADTLAAIASRLSAPGTLRNGAQLRGRDGSTFVSAEIWRSTADEDSSGDILTWVTDDPTTGQFDAVDVHARDDSDWPPAAIDVTAPGARESRACASVNVGKTEAEVDCEDSKANGQVAVDVDCGDL